MTNGVYAAVHAVEPPGGHAASYGASAESKVAQLIESDHPVLPGRQFRYGAL